MSDLRETAPAPGSAEAHYASLLAPIYSWMVGGASHAFVLGAADLDGLLPGGSLAVDLGCGFGMHTVPLARAGWTVIGVDSSATLLDELRQHAEGLPVFAATGDLVAFRSHLPPGQRPDLVLCMGDTLTHLPDMPSVTTLARNVASVLPAHGRFIATFRDYSRLPSGTARFIPVRSDADRILTCFLEDHGDHVEVHDLLHSRTGETWALTVSSYRKLRVSSDAIRDVFAQAGLRADVVPGPRGMLRLVCHPRS